MGHKVSPLLLRLGYIQDWRSKWFAKKSDYAKFVHMDLQIRKYIKDNYKQAAISKIVIERLTDKMKIKIYCARPGLIIGRHGQDIDRLRGELAAIAKQELSIEPLEVKQPAADAQLTAQNVATQLEKRIAFRRAIKRSIEQATASGVKGIKISVAGRLGGAEMSRRETYKQGKLPLSTLRADIDYGFAEALTTYGLIGVKAWIYKGEVLLKLKKQPAIAAEELPNLRKP